MSDLPCSLFLEHNMKMISEPLISVVVPIYNVEQYLERCINSILHQTYQNLEIILVDDGSPDNSGAICDSYSSLDQRIKVIHKRNGGLSDARNVGLDMAGGEFIAFVDSDDALLVAAKGKIQNVKKVAEEIKKRQ